jgi:hypothetical protein
MNNQSILTPKYYKKEKISTPCYASGDEILLMVAIHDQASAGCEAAMLIFDTMGDTNA